MAILNAGFFATNSAQTSARSEMSSSSDDDGDGFLGRCDPELFAKEGPRGAAGAAAGAAAAGPASYAPARSRRSPAEAFYDAVFKDAADAKRESRRERDERRWTRSRALCTARSSTRPSKRRCGRSATSCGRGRTCFMTWAAARGGAGRRGGRAVPLSRLPRRRAAGGPEPPRARRQGLVEAAEWTLGHARPAVEFYEGDITDLKFHDWTADGDVVLVNSTCFDDDLLKAVADLAEGAAARRFRDHVHAAPTITPVHDRGRGAPPDELRAARRSSSSGATARTSGPRSWSGLGGNGGGRRRWVFRYGRGRWPSRISAAIRSAPRWGEGSKGGEARRGEKRAGPLYADFSPFRRRTRGH